ncbi:MAG: spore germination protein [Halanaerobiales bacterium]|nr:spore germination protein [Halanaerobiales bacterium]
MFKIISKIFRCLMRNPENNGMKYSMKVKNVPNSIKLIKKELEEIFSDCSDFIVREISIGNEVEIKILIAFMEGFVDKIMVNDGILRPLMIDSRQTILKKDINKSTIIDLLKENLLSVNDLKELKDFGQTIDNILSGDTVIYIDGKSIAFTAGMRGWEQRGVEEPDTEAVVRGPCETLRTNTSLLRRKIKNPNLKLEMMKLGRQTNTDICISYIKGLVNEDLVKTVKRRLSKIDIDAILETGYIEELIEDAPLSIFPTVGNSEKPDIVAAKLLEGRVAIFCDGTPFVLIVPYLLIETIQASEDYYSRAVFASFIRLVRILALIISSTLPAIYVAGNIRFF